MWHMKKDAQHNDGKRNWMRKNANRKIPAKNDETHFVMRTERKKDSCKESTE